jgi:hypothetical protein
VVSFFGLIAPPVVQALWKPCSSAALLHCVQSLQAGKAARVADKPR